MKSRRKNISQLKLNIKQIIDNIQQLTKCKTHDVVGVGNLQTGTENLFTELENLPLHRFKKNLKRRQTKKLCKYVSKVNQSLNSSKRHMGVEISCSPITSLVCSEPNQNLDKNITSIKECKRFLQSFELLEQLHLARGHNYSETYKFSLKLRQLKSIWNCFLQDNLQEQTSTEDKIQRQWNEVLFGPAEKTYFHDKPDLNDFVRKRQTWDSYIDNKYGSAIPIGWIVPCVDVNEQWQTHLEATNI